MADMKSRLPHQALLLTLAAGLTIGLTAIWASQRYASQPADQRTFVVEERPLTIELAVLGTIGPGHTTPVTAPYTAAIRERHFTYGTLVKVGDLLAVLDSAEIEARLREAQSQLIKAEMALRLLENWSTSADVLGAKRTLDQAESSLRVLERQVADTQSLYQKGIVSRNELDTLTQQRDAQQSNVSAARQDFESVLQRGNKENRRLAILDLETAKARWADIKAQHDSAAIRAPESGIVLRPNPQPSAKSGSSSEIVGTIQQGHVILLIADPNSYTVSSQVSEFDINAIKTGEPVTIHIEAVQGKQLRGRLLSISAEAGQDPASNSPTYAVLASIQAEPPIPRLRFGMTANLRIPIYENPRAVILPLEAVRNLQASPAVALQDHKTGQLTTVPVAIGRTTTDGIEILSGLRAGDTVILPH